MLVLRLRQMTMILLAVLLLIPSQFSGHKALAAPPPWVLAEGSLTGLNELPTSAYAPATAVFNGKLYAAWQQNAGLTNQIHVKSYNGLEWVSENGAYPNGINENSANYASLVKLVVFKNDLYAVWSETYGGSGQLYVKKYDGGNWTRVDGSGTSGLNVQNTNTASYPDAIVSNDELYVAWQENNVNKVYVKKFDGTTWSNADGAAVAAGLNVNAAPTPVMAPRMAVYNGKVHVIWSESTGAARHIYVKMLNGTNWEPVGWSGTTGINVSSAAFAEYPVMAVYNGELYAAWQEPTTANSKKQIRVKKYTGSGWDSADGDGVYGLNVDSGSDATFPMMIASSDALYVTWMESPMMLAPSVLRAAKFEGTSWYNIDGMGSNGLNVSPGSYVSSPTLAVFNQTVYDVWSESPSGSSYQIRVKRFGPISADAAKNSVSASQSSVTVGDTLTLTAAGDRQTAAGAVNGDLRYVPFSWTSTEPGKTGLFNENSGSYTSDYTPSIAGTYTVTVDYKKDVWNGSEWIFANNVDEKTVGITVNAAIPPTTANPLNNAVSASQSSVMAGSPLTLTATGDRQSATGAVYGDERYVPLSWKSSEGSEKAGPFILSGGSYFSTYTPSVEGTYTVSALFSRQSWDGNNWNDTSDQSNATTTVTVITASGQPTLADASKNVISANPSSVFVGDTVTLTAAGDRQAVTGIVYGDERYVPVGWTSTESGKTGTFSKSGNDYTSDYTPSSVGSYTVTVDYKKETWNVTEWVYGNYVDKKTVTVNATPVTAVFADASKNSITANPSSVIIGGTTTLTAAGDRQTVAGIVYGDERYVPASWTSTESGKTGVFNQNGNDYTSSYTPSSLGSYTVTVSFKKEMWNVTEWVYSNDIDEKTITITARILQSSSGGNGGNSGNTGSASSSDFSSDSSVIVQVNGKSENAGTATSSKRDGQSVLTIVVDPKKLSAKLAEEGQHALVTIPVDSQSDVVIGELTGQMIKEMENQQAVFEIKTPLAAYTVPALQINMDAIAGQFGGSPSLQDIHVQIEIAAPTAAVMKAIEDAANKGSFSVAVPPVTFTIKATYENKTIEVSSFNAYVERTIAIPDGIDPGKITTGVVMDADGTVRHVPTRVVVQDGKYYAKLNSLTNSTYALVWNPQEYSDVAAHWAKQPVNDIGSRMVVSGTGDNLFNPDRDITRGEFAAIIVRGLALKVENGTTSFSDVKAADWYSGAIRTAAAYRLISGFEDGTFRPNESITREQAMMIIARAMEITGLRDTLSASSTDAKLRSYTDAANISSWAQSSVADSLAAGIMTGRTSEELAPKANITRAEVAVIIQRLLRISGLI